jgi:hypothetical protein
MALGTVDADLGRLSVIDDAVPRSQVGKTKRHINFMPEYQKSTTGELLIQKTKHQGVLTNWRFMTQIHTSPTCVDGLESQQNGVCSSSSGRSPYHPAEDAPVRSPGQLLHWRAETSA